MKLAFSLLLGLYLALTPRPSPAWAAGEGSSGPGSPSPSMERGPGGEVHDAGPGRAVRWYAIPNVGYDSDDGLGFGARAEVALDEPGYTPYHSAYVVHAFLTTRGYHHHRFRFDRTGLGPDGRLRVTLHVAWRQWLNDGYWGLGDRTAREPDPTAKRYRYSLFQPFVHLTLRARLDGPWQAFASLNVKWSAVRTYAGSLLAEQRPYGLDGGLAAILSAGVLYDTRQPELAPHRGVLVELSGRGTPPLPRGAGAFGGPFAALRGFVELAPWCVLGGRAMVEYLWGNVPFYEMVHWGGAIPVAGFGGADTLRGALFGRWHAPGKALANLEVRFDVLTHGLAGKPFVWQLVPFVDAGVVFGPSPSLAAGAAALPTGGWPVHPSAGLGLHVVYADAFVGRIDAGVSPDPRQRADGRVVDELAWGVYVVFDQTF